jgi:hypothetical protein
LPQLLSLRSPPVLRLKQLLSPAAPLVLVPGLSAHALPAPPLGSAAQELQRRCQAKRGRVQYAGAVRRRSCSSRTATDHSTAAQACSTVTTPRVCQRQARGAPPAPRCPCPAVPCPCSQLQAGRQGAHTINSWLVLPTFCSSAQHSKLVRFPGVEQQGLWLPACAAHPAQTRRQRPACAAPQPPGGATRAACARQGLGKSV